MTRLAAPRPFSFRARPIPVPGDLRIEWRVSLIMLMLGYSRARQASLAKLHILNDAIRSKKPEALLEMIAHAKVGSLPWALRVEPAFGRAIDFAVGDKFAVWTTPSGRSSLKLTVTGEALFDQLVKAPDILSVEAAFCQKYAKSITETTVGLVIGQKRSEL